VGIPSISIVTPTLNAERYLAQCLASVRSQGYPDLEHLVVDGGSMDATQRIVVENGARWVSRPGLTQTAAINAGLRSATGEVVAWLNADDLYAPGTLATVADRFAASPHLDALYGDCDVIGERGQRLWRQEPGAYDFDRLLRRGNTLAQPAVFLRRRVFDQVGYLDESLDFGMDYELWLRLRGLQIEYLPRVLAAFRWHPASKTASNNPANWRELITIVRRHGGGWTPQLVWLFARARLTLARQQLKRTLPVAR
jgi:glycosyltransferase involved in cell wall biosynthesis